MFRRASNSKLLRLAAHTVLLASLVFAAFAHTVPPLSTPAGIDERAYAAQYILPDGTLPIICDRFGNSGTHHPSSMPCEFCALADNSALPAPISKAYLGNCLTNLNNPQSADNQVLARTIHGLHGASRAPPRI